MFDTLCRNGHNELTKVAEDVEDVANEGTGCVIDALVGQAQDTISGADGHICRTFSPSMSISLSKRSRGKRCESGLEVGNGGIGGHERENLGPQGAEQLIKPTGCSHKRGL